jgi:DNA-binding transcriptional regulator GbsR (MarR family)
LSALETEVVELFVELSRLLGQPKSIGEIYGLLFISKDPMSMEELCARLGLSSGSASQGLRYLRNLGAVRKVYVAGERRDYFSAVAELRELVGRFLKDHITPQFDEGLKRLDRIEALTRELEGDEKRRVGLKVTMLRSWARNGKTFLPLIVKVLGR